MSLKARVLKHGVCEITQEYKGTAHNGIDIVKEGYQLDNIVAHSDGVVSQVINTERNNTPNQPSNGGNIVKIDHGNGYSTRYLHLAYNTVKVRVGEQVKKGQVLGYMGNTGYSFGGHLHFEVLKDNKQIDPTPYLDADLPKETVSSNDVNVFYRVKTQKHGWLPEVKNLDDYAGWEDSPITAIAMRVDKGTIRYRVHVKGGIWYDYITEYNINDIINGFAGDGENAIDLIEVYYYTPNNIRPYKKAKYKVNNYPYQYDNEKTNGQDGYAGVLGVVATKFQIVIE